jgi:membrane associated rhomboid family serine protease
MSISPPPANPVLDAYETFVRETPLVTRYILISQVITWIISFFMDLSLAVANVPQFTIFKFELYRIILSPFICPGLFSLVFAYLSFTENGRRLEFSMGSTAFACLILTIGIISNLGHLMVTILLYGVTGSEEWLLLPSQGIWIILFGVIAIECSQAPSNSMRKLFFFTVPTLYYPLALFGLFSLLGGFQLPYLLSIGVGYAYGYVTSLPLLSFLSRLLLICMYLFMYVLLILSCAAAVTWTD